MNNKVLRTLFVLSILATVLTGVGLLLTVVLRTDAGSDWLLARYPRYALAMRGFRTLQDMKYPVKSGENQTTNVGVLSIEDPSWPVMLSFIRSEIAVRKSERNEPVPWVPAPSSTGAAPPKQLPPVNYERIKTIVSARVDVMQAGTRPILPPFSLVVLWPEATSRRMYEFLSWEEFRLDIHQMMLQELDTIAQWIALGAFACGVLTTTARWALSKKLSAQAPEAPVTTPAAAAP